MRQAKLAAKTTVVLSDVVVVAISGAGKDVYVSDAKGGDYSGVDIYGTTTGVPTAPGGEYKVAGTVSTATNGNVEISKATFTLINAAGPAVTKLGVAASKLAEGTSNAELYGVYVTATGGAATVSNITPTNPDLVNTKYTAAMETACRNFATSGATTDSAQCCPSGVGPKYYGFEAQVAGQTIAISTGNYPSTKNNEQGIELEVWPCDGNFGEIVTVGESLGTLSGIFDIGYSSTGPSLSPASPADVTLSSGTSGGSSSGSTGSSTGSTTGSSTGSTTGSSTGSTTGSSTGSTTGSSTGSTTGSSTGSTTGSTGSTTGGTTWPAPLCVACTDDRQCGQDGNLCITDNGGNGYCGYACTDDHDCPDGASCYEIDRDDGLRLGYNCFPDENVATPYVNACVGQ